MNELDHKGPAGDSPFTPAEIGDRAAEIISGSVENAMRTLRQAYPNAGFKRRRIERQILTHAMNGMGYRFVGVIAGLRMTYEAKLRAARYKLYVSAVVCVVGIVGWLI